MRRVELGAIYREALDLALTLHHGQVRKGTRVPYATHLLSTSALVLQFGGDEEQAIAGLLHDAAEDAGGRPTLERIRKAFGDRVARIVDACTDTFEDPKPAWRPRKEAFIAGVAAEAADALLVTACDKLDNARAIVADLRSDGARTLDRFAGGADTVWYYRAIADALRATGKVERVVGELEEAVRAMERIGGGRG
ncbi:MAG TPA: HD domain-containing protein [Anaeromyxobacteraceae bacterium]|jgi:(p)ppGpp synthase/HD superfamily hydrolase